MTKGSENPFPYITLVDTADPATPPAGQKYLWMDTDDILKLKDESGTVSAVGGAAGAVATDAIWDAAGDLAQGTGANTAAKLSAGTAGQFLMSGGAAAANAWASRELDYVQYTSPVSITATTEATANTVVTGSAVAYDGSTIVVIEFFAPYAECPDNNNLWLDLYDGSSSIGFMGLYTTSDAIGVGRVPVHLSRRLTPSAATHTYSIRSHVGSGTGSVAGGAGTAAAYAPGFIRIVRAK